MKKYVILSTDKNPDYAYFEPITVWAWKQFGWTPIVMNLEIEGYRSATIAQISRLYASCIIDEGYVMTADIDMLPLSDYWHADFANKTVYGYDLTGHKEYPICYIGMPAEQWREVMQLDMKKGMEYFIRRDLDSMPNTKSDDFYKWWGIDQQLITERLKPYSPTIIERGQYPNGFARGRVDRGAWSLSHSEFIDCHMFQQMYHKGREQYFEKTMELLHALWPEEDFQWIRDYTDEFRKKTGHA